MEILPQDDWPSSWTNILDLSFKSIFTLTTTSLQTHFWREKLVYGHLGLSFFTNMKRVSSFPKISTLKYPKREIHISHSDQTISTNMCNREGGAVQFFDSTKAKSENYFYPFFIDLVKFGQKIECRYFYLGYIGQAWMASVIKIQNVPLSKIEALKIRI